MIFDLSQTSTHQNYNLLIGLVAPRPIAWITSMDLAGKLECGAIQRLQLCTGVDPPIVAVGVGNRPGPGIVGKDTAQNIRSTREFVVNVVNEAVAEAMNFTAIDFPAGVNELNWPNLRLRRQRS